MVYFLHHGQRAKLVYGDIRFLDIPVTFPMSAPAVVAASVYMKPKSLLLFLRYGARICQSPVENEWDMTTLMRHFLRLLWTCIGSEALTDTFSKDNSKKVVCTTTQDVTNCIRILLRAVPQIDKRNMQFPLVTLEKGKLSRYMHSGSFIRWVSDLRIVSTLSVRCFGPSELQHLCRCRIREMLNVRTMLPFGIDALLLPPALKRYLDLFED